MALATTFEVAKKGVKKRYRVENITSTAAKPEVTYLYHTNDDTQVKISDGADSRPGTSENSPNVQIFQPLSTEGIGGLIEQLQDLNLEMRSVLEQVSTNPAFRATLLAGKT